MNITSKSRYALKIMMELARHGQNAKLQRSEIAKAQGIPPDYMDHIVSRLRDAGMIESIRGRSGGYRLGKDPAELSVWDIFRAVEDAMHPVVCLDPGHACVAESSCSSRDAWGLIMDGVRDALRAIILADIVERAKSLQDPAEVFNLAANQECRAPRKRAGATEL